MKPFSVAVVLPNAVLPAADWADRYEIDLPDGRFTPTEAARRTLGAAPPWIKRLLALRNRIVSVFGLRGAEMGVGDARAIDVFPVLRETERETVLGFNDRHLDFRVLVDVRPNRANGQIVGMTTLVFRKNLFGWIYLAVITPFHKVIVRRLLSGLARS